MLSPFLCCETNALFVLYHVLNMKPFCMLLFWNISLAYLPMPKKLILIVNIQSWNLCSCPCMFELSCVSKQLAEMRCWQQLCMMLVRAAMCSAPCPLLHWPKLVHGHKLSEGLLLAVSLLLPGWGTANLVAVVPLRSSQIDSLRLDSLGQDWFGFVRGTKHELCCVSDSICCESHFRLILCLKKWCQDQTLGVNAPQHSLCLLFPLFSAKNPALKD